MYKAGPFMEHLFVLFVRTGDEDEIVARIERELNSDMIHPFVPCKMVSFRKRGTTKQVVQVCFPGYVFLESAMDGGQFFEVEYQNIRKIKGIYKLLNYGSIYDIAMQEDEKDALLALYRNKIEKSIGVIEGDMVQIISGPLMGRESVIRKINRHRREAVVEVTMFGRVQPVILPLEIISKK